MAIWRYKSIKKLNTDLTRTLEARRKAEMAIKEISRFPNENPNSVFRVSAAGLILYKNQPGSLLLRDEQGREDQTIPRHWRRVALDTLAKKTSLTIETTFKEKIFLLTFAPVVESGYVNIYAHDITERKKAEEEAKIRRQQAIRADRLASLGELVAGVAHEINNPNQTITSNINRITAAWQSAIPILEEYFEVNGDFLLGGLEFSEMREEMPRFVKGISAGAKRINEIVVDLKSYARHEAPEGEDTDVEINLVVRTAVEIMNTFVNKATKRFTVEYAPGIPPVRGNVQRLEQVVINLLQNACQALTSRDRGIFVTSEYNQETHCAEIRIRDEGVGITPEELSRIQDPFFTTKREKGGTGLGLSISSTIVKEHNGALNFRSEPGQGTTVTVVLPVTGKDATKEAVM